MIDMGFASFLTLLVISFITALVMHYAIRYRVLDGIDGFAAKWIAGWVVAWLASPVLGHWFAGAEISNVYIVPALIGGFIGAFVPAAMWKASAMVAGKPRAFDVHQTTKAA
jgi:uncharacterized membrane protein YeaQ/YmgE (transglycosylase-associated protein family)